MATRMLQRRGTAAEWAALNVILGDGELGWERDTGVIKIGDGVTAWNDLETWFVLRTIVDAKGDILVGLADNVLGRLPVGVEGNSLFVQEDGSIAWDVPYSGADRVDKSGDSMTGPLQVPRIDLGAVNLLDSGGALAVTTDDGVTLASLGAGNVYDNGERVYSPNNPPAATDTSGLASQAQLAAQGRKWTKTFMMMGA